MNFIPPENLRLAREALVGLPRPDSLARQLLNEWLKKQGVALPPESIDVVTLHYQLERQQDDAGKPFVRENAVIMQRMSLIEALLGNWQGESTATFGGFHFGDWAGIAPSSSVNLVTRLKPLDLFSNGSPFIVFNGLYQRTEPASYGPHNRVQIRAEDFQSFIWGLHLHNRYKTSLDDYWNTHLTLYQRGLKISFIAACNKQLLEGSLCEQAKRLAWQAADLIPRSPSTQVSMLNVYGYASSSILCIRDTASGLTLLYLPGNTSPFHEFIERKAMKAWFAEQCQNPSKRQALLQAFSPLDWPDGLDFSGVRTALTGLGRFPAAHHFPVNHPGFATSGIWDPQAIVDFQPDKYSPHIGDDLFHYLARLQKQRSYQDANSQITTNHQIDKAQWVSFLNLAMTIAAPLVLVVPELTPMLVIGGLAQFSLGMDRVVNGRSLEEKAEGVTDQVYGLFNAVPTAINLARASRDLFSWCRPDFAVPSRLRSLMNQSTPDEADAIEMQPAQSAFRQAPQLSDAQLASVVARVDASLEHRFIGYFHDGQEIVSEWVKYEISSNSFIRTRDALLAQPPRWVPGGDALVPLEAPERLVSNAQRMATLRTLGINLQLPIKLAAYDLLQCTPIPRLITSVWVGDRLIAGEFLDSLVHNAQAAKDSGYRFQLLLSRMNRGAYEANFAQLTDKAPALEVLPLEDQSFYQTFLKSPFYHQYQSAIEGNGGTATNFSSASDILRYRVLHHFGGLYLDADDRLLVTVHNQQSHVPLLDTELSTTQDGLLLAPPVSNDQLGMYIKYNTSMIGSHAGNPTLDTISYEMRRRFDLAADFYQHRPDPTNAPTAFSTYTRRLSQLTGPGMLNEVIDQHLPWLSQLREICNLLASPIHDIRQTVDLSEFMQRIHAYAPLDRVARIGQAHSWLHL
ncbi:dermonecrotic toxin domain-containing protein [Pseudomonas sp. KU43P]|uniref:dermonecrotic toxin domain-containing protein n=1 Tax=Pseudomonas sp. KU43P TaxID=2487887 RepID=UPI0012AA07CE|nr:DUF6543 domain-containing protein [Pseudomonas sp. KU43P]BBH45118.1 hypothetical protein KU43P_15950 [Pseudomonas sp. KU43P]